MSKFFNETIKLRSSGGLKVEDLILTPSPDGAKDAKEQEPTVAAAAPPAHSVATSGVENESAAAVSVITAEPEPMAEQEPVVAAPTIAEPPITEPAKEAETILIEPPAQTLVASRLARCRKVEISEQKTLRGQFQGSLSLESAEEAYLALRTRLMRMRAAKGLRSVVITSTIQGEGKTLTASNLAMFSAQLQDMRLLLIDSDVRTSGLSRHLDIPQSPGLAEVLSGECEPEDAVVETNVKNLYVLPSGACPKSSAELFANRRWPELIAWCNESFKLTLVDAPPILNLADVELIAAGCDAALMVVRAQYIQRDLLTKAAAQLDSKKLLGLVYNGAEIVHQRYYYGYGTPQKG